MNEETKEQGFPIEVGCEITTWNRQKKTGGRGIVLEICKDYIRVLRRNDKVSKVFRVKPSAIVCVTKTMNDMVTIANRMSQGA
jgi:hypothetical protein